MHGGQPYGVTGDGSTAEKLVYSISTHSTSIAAQTKRLKAEVTKLKHVVDAKKNELRYLQTSNNNCLLYTSPSPRDRG